MQKKLEKLKEYITVLGPLGIAFSGGVDSTFLLKTAHDVLGDSVTAFTARLRSVPARELERAQSFCEKEGIDHVILDIDELKIKGFAQNPPERCYICKTEILKSMRSAAVARGIQNIAEGSNADDEGDYRPGRRAVREQNIRSPLLFAGLCKSEIRELSKQAGLDTWDMPALACLSSRIPYGDTITAAKLDMIDKAEQFLAGMGFKQVRVRVHGSLARIEVRECEIEKLVSRAPDISAHLKKIGFSYVSADLEGYRTGSMNEVLA